MKQPSISKWQLVFLTLGSALMFPYTSMPLLDSPPYNSDVLFALLLSIIYILIINIPIMYIANKFRGLTITQCFDAIAGKIVGKFFGALFMLFFFMCFTSCMIHALQFVNTTHMSRTPMWALLLLALLPITYLSIKGPGVIARISQYIIPLILTTVIGFGLLGLPIMKLENIKPFLADSKLLDINLGALSTAARFSEVNIIFIFGYYLKKQASINKVYGATISMYYIFSFIIAASTLLSLGYEYASIVRNPYYVFSRQVELTQAIERVQAFNTFTWFPCTLIKLGVYNFMSSFILAQYFPKLRRRYFCIALSTMAFILGLMPFIDNTMFFDKLLSVNVFPFIIGTIVFVLPLLLVIIYALNKKSTDNKLKIMLEENEKAEVDKPKEQASMGRRRVVEA